MSLIPISLSIAAGTIFRRILMDEILKMITKAMSNPL
jgi:hypothetical protein